MYPLPDIPNQPFTSLARWGWWLPESGAIPASWRFAVSQAVTRLRGGREALLKALEAPQRLVRDAGTPPLPWPEGKRWAALLTHDVDTVKGLEGSKWLREAEAARDLTGLYFVVGKVLTESSQGTRFQGGALGLHGLHHDLRLTRQDPEAFLKEVELWAPVAQELGTLGFRAPFLYLPRPHWEWLPPWLGFDSSLPSWDPASPFGRRGCQTSRPFRIPGSAGVPPVIDSGLWELPPSLPLDDTLLRLGFEGDALVNFLLRLAGEVRCVGGLLVYTGHAEPHLSGNRSGAERYGKFLDGLKAKPDLWMPTPRELMAWLQKQAAAP